MINLTLERCVPLTEAGLEGCLSQGILVPSRCLRRQGKEMISSSRASRVRTVYSSPLFEPAEADFRV